jgi:hypothetical protein
MNMIDIGYGSVLNAARIVAAVPADSAPVKRLIGAAREKNLLVDATCGKRTKIVYVMDSGHVVLSTKEFQEPETKEIKASKPRAAKAKQGQLKGRALPARELPDEAKARKK